MSLYSGVVWMLVLPGPLPEPRCSPPWRELSTEVWTFLTLWNVSPDTTTRRSLWMLRFTGTTSSDSTLPSTWSTYRLVLFTFLNYVFNQHYFKMFRKKANSSNYYPISLFFFVKNWISVHLNYILLAITHSWFTLFCWLLFDHCSIISINSLNFLQYLNLPCSGGRGGNLQEAVLQVH